MKGKISISLLIIGFVAIFVAGFYIGKVSVVQKFCPPEEVDFSLLWETWHKLEGNYVNPEKLDRQKMVYGAISGMVKAIGDPYTLFFNPEDTKKFLEDISGSFEGVGMEIGIRKGQVQVIAPLEGTPAQEAGIRSGDKIIKIDDTLTMDITIEEAVSLIRGPKGTEVLLTIMRDEWDGPKEFKVKRDVIEIPSMKWELKENNIAYIKLYHFSERSHLDFQKIALEILNSSADRIILDLRNNPGGYLERAQNIAGWFLERGQTVVIEDFGAGKEQEIYKAEGNSQLKDYPLVILLNQGSASASEILASALRDNRGVKIIGETSYGKGSVQKLEELEGGSSLKVTIANWLSPNGELIADKGLKPDIEVIMTDQDYNEEKDPQLDKALEIIKEIK
jgi:carboxyl-terminal processing protease